MKKINVALIAIAVILVVGLIIWVVVARSLGDVAGPLEQVGEAVGEQLQEIANPTPTIIADPITIIHEMQSLSRLETAVYTIEKVITAQSGQGAFAFLFGDQLVLVAHGQVIAGVDLALVDEDDVRVVDGMVYVRLPQAEVFVTTLDEEQTYVFDRDTGIAGMNQDLESEARLAAEQEIEAAALEDGILQMAQQNAELYIQRLLLSLDFDNVVFLDPDEAFPVEPTE